jgi:hypothetical protein
VYLQDNCDGRPPSADTREVIGVEQDREVYVVSVGLVGTLLPGEYERVFVSAAGLSRIFLPCADSPPAECVLKLPHKAGEKWELPAVKGSRGVVIGVVVNPRPSIQCLAREPEEVEVPAGKYRALRVDQTMGTGNDAVRSSWWFAPHIGPVKWTHKDRTREFVMVLKSFTPGK